MYIASGIEGVLGEAIWQGVTEKSEAPRHVTLGQWLYTPGTCRCVQYSSGPAAYAVCAQEIGAACRRLVRRRVSWRGGDQQ